MYEDFVRLRVIYGHFVVNIVAVGPNRGWLRLWFHDRSRTNASQQKFLLAEFDLQPVFDDKDNLLTVDEVIYLAPRFEISGCSSRYHVETARLPLDII
jgi:hypothetical protein